MLGLHPSLTEIQLHQVLKTRWWFLRSEDHSMNHGSPSLAAGNCWRQRKPMPLSSFRATLKEWPNACASCGTSASEGACVIPEKCRKIIPEKILIQYWIWCDNLMISGRFLYAYICILSVESLAPYRVETSPWGMAADLLPVTPSAPGVSCAVTSRLAKASRAVRHHRGIGCVTVQQIHPSKTPLADIFSRCLRDTFGCSPPL